MSFFRSFVRCYYVDLGYVDKYVGSVSPAFGDAHLENFGFNVFANDSVRFVYNDFDDSGYCPVSIDAVRYFVVLRLLKVEEKTIKDLIKYYTNLVTDKEPLDLEKKSQHWKIKNKSIYDYWKPKKRLKKAIEKFQTCKPSSSPLVSDIIKSFQDKKKLKKFKIDDVRDYDEHQTGGSGGLSRFWVSVKENDDNIIDIIEFKQITKYPGIGHQWSKDPLLDTRTKWCANHLWPPLKRYLDLEVKLGDTYFMVRSRTKQTLKLETDEEKLDLWKIQLEIMSVRHFDGWKGYTSKVVKKWLNTNSAYISQRYTTIFTNCQSKLANV